MTAMEPGESAAHPSVAELQAIIAQQARELVDLRQHTAAAGLGDRLRDGLRLASVADTIAGSGSHPRLLELIVATAARVIGARRGSLFLVDDARQELVFEVALGEPLEEFKSLRLPLGHGIAGMVALTGQPMAINDVVSDPRHASEIAQRTGYTPTDLVCVPLAHDDRIIGVIELLDKVDGSAFSLSDIDTLTLFGTQAAITIVQSRARGDLAALLAEAISGPLGTSPESDVQDDLRVVLSGIAHDHRHQQALALARLVQEIADYGDLETAACQAMLRGFSEYLKSQPQPGIEMTPRA